MTKQFDVGFLSPPIILDAVLKKDIRIVASLKDILPEREDMTAKSILIHEKAVANKMPALKCWFKGVNESIDYFYASDEAVKKYADIFGMSLESVTYSRNLFERKQWFRPEVKGVDIQMQEGIQFKYLTEPLTEEQIKKLIVRLD